VPSAPKSSCIRPHHDSKISNRQSTFPAPSAVAHPKPQIAELPRQIVEVSPFQGNFLCQDRPKLLPIPQSVHAEFGYPQITWAARLQNGRHGNFLASTCWELLSVSHSSCLPPPATPCSGEQRQGECGKCRYEQIFSYLQAEKKREVSITARPASVLLGG
jgi:hypothetical protein